MANPDDNKIENTPTTDDVTLENMSDLYDKLPAIGSEPDHGSADRAQEIPALLESAPPAQEQPEAAAQEVIAEEAAAVQPEEEAPSEAVAVPQDSSPLQGEAPRMTIQYLESPTTSQELAALRTDLKSVLGAMQVFQGDAEQFSAKLDAISSETGSLTGKINEIALNHELVSAELETLTSGSGSKNVLSKSFLIISCATLFLLVVFQIYMFISLINVEKLQTASGPALLEGFKALDKKLADYNAGLAKVAAPAPQEHVQAQHTTATGPNGHDAAAQHAATAATIVPLPEKLNRLRNGQAEKKLVRKETGDWFVYTKKPEECITDADIIEALNSAYKRLGRPLTTKTPLPSHNSLCILKPDGKGGTEIVMTKDFAP